MENRNTKQREILCNLINNSSCHYDINQIYDNVKNDMGLATVYRNLEYLSNNNLIRKIKLNSNKVVYDKISNYHYHMECMKCCKIFDIDIEKLPYINQLDDFLNKNIEDKIVNHDIIFSCICKQCLNK